MGPAASGQTLAPIIRTTIQIFILTFLVSCSGRQQVPTHTDVFTHLDNNTGDTIKFYGFKDLDTAIFHATREHKSILVIFSGYACMAVGGQEWKTLSLFPDRDKIQEKFVIAWLPVDDKRNLTDTSQIVFLHGKQRRLVSVGDKNNFLEESLYTLSTQPLFCFMDTEKKPFGQTLGYTKNQNEVETFITSGLTK